MTPFIITLATQLIGRGISFVLSNGISIPGTPDVLTRMSYKTGIPLGPRIVLPWVAVIAIGMIVLFGLFLGRTNWGRFIALTGSNQQAARYAGIKVPLILCSVYAVAGLLSGIAGFMSIMSLGTADPKVGDPLLLTIIGSVILGGVSLSGGEGSMLKAAMGMLLFATLINGMTFLNLSLAQQQIIQGLILIIGMALGARFATRRVEQ
jgi:ribose transport system permease protein